MASTSTPPPNPYAALISQNLTVIPTFTFESGAELTQVPVGYKTWGRLNDKGDNCLVINHALTGSADVEDWWGPLLGPSKAFDPTRFFIFCGNVIGSPYGTVSSVTVNPETGRPYGPEMPGSSVKDDVRLHYFVLKQLGVTSIAAVIGGSMGGMTTLEYALNTPPGFVRAIIPLATSARHSAWCISWGEAQRQSIYSDPDYKDGYYYETSTGEISLANQPTRGLAAARMAALLTYRSRDSFESRFGRKAGVNKPKSKVPKGGVRVMGGNETTNPAEPSEAELESQKIRSPREEAFQLHNDGHRLGMGSRRTSNSSSSSSLSALPNGEERGQTNLDLGIPSRNGSGVGQGVPLGLTGEERTPKIFSAQSYLRYQGDKFTSRFDANCYIHITRKLDTHDLSFPSTSSTPPTLSSALPPVAPSADDNDIEAALHHALSLLPPALVIGIESDGLFTTSEQKEIAAHIPDAELVLIPSPDGHDGFLLEFQAINGWIDGWLRRKMPEFYTDEARLISLEEYKKGKEEDREGWGVQKESVFGEAEADVTRW
ncbi:homoserine O-acetyltransferase/O-succinyltransferase, partial [Tremellales sp. Uapishka_1]